MEVLNPPGFADAVLGAPKDWDEAKNGKCEGLPVKIINGAFVSLWKPSPEELFLLNQGMPLALHIHSPVHPAVSLGVVEPEQEVAGHG